MNNIDLSDYKTLITVQVEPSDLYENTLGRASFTVVRCDLGDDDVIEEADYVEARVHYGFLTVGRYLAQVTEIDGDTATITLIRSHA